MGISIISDDDVRLKWRKIVSSRQTAKLRSAWCCAESLWSTCYYEPEERLLVTFRAAGASSASRTAILTSSLHRNPRFSHGRGRHRCRMAMVVITQLLSVVPVGDSGGSDWPRWSEAPEGRGRTLFSDNQDGYPSRRMIDFLKLLAGFFLGLFRSHATREAEKMFPEAICSSDD